MTWLPHSWNHGLVRSPEVSRRHSIHSPLCEMFTSCSTAQNWFSVIPGLRTARMVSIARSPTAVAIRKHSSSSSDLTMRAISIAALASASSRPRAVSSWADVGSHRSTSNRGLPAPNVRTSSAISSAHTVVFSWRRDPAIR